MPLVWIQSKNINPALWKNGSLCTYRSQSPTNPCNETMRWGLKEKKVMGLLRKGSTMTSFCKPKRLGRNSLR